MQTLQFNVQKIYFHIVNEKLKEKKSKSKIEIKYSCKCRNRYSDLDLQIVLDRDEKNFLKINNLYVPEGIQNQSRFHTAFLEIPLKRENYKNH